MNLDRAQSTVERYAFYALTVSIPVQSLVILPWIGVTLTKAAGAVLIATATIRIVQRKTQTPLLRPADLGVLLFFTVAALSYFSSIDPAVTLSTLIALGTYVLIFYAILITVDAEALRGAARLFVWMNAFLGVAAVIAYAGLIQPAVDTVLEGTNIRRIAMGLPDPNEQALWATVAIAIVLFRRTANRAAHITASIQVAAISLGLALTMSRTGWFVAAVLGVAWMLTHRSQWRRIAPAVVVACIAAGGFFLLDIPAAETMRSRLRQAFDVNDLSIASRITHYADAAGIAWQGGLLGHGAGTAPIVADRLTDPRGDAIGSVVHSVPLTIWMEMGVAGAIMGAWFTAGVIASILSTNKEREEVLAPITIRAIAAAVTVYGIFALVMPFLYRSGLAVGAAAVISATHNAAALPIASVLRRQAIAFASVIAVVGFITGITSSFGANAARTAYAQHLTSDIEFAIADMQYGAAERIALKAIDRSPEFANLIEEITESSFAVMPRLVEALNVEPKDPNDLTPLNPEGYAAGVPGGPFEAEAHYAKGYQAEAAGDTAGSVEAYAAAIDAAPNHRRAALGLLRVLR